MSETKGNLLLAIELKLDRPTVFQLFVDELGAALASSEILFDPGSKGRIVQGSHETGRISEWKQGERISLQWFPADWDRQKSTTIDIRFSATKTGTRIAIEHHGWDEVVEDATDLAGWFAAELIAPLLRASSPKRLGDWLTDRKARRPSGMQAQSTYRDPLYHHPNFSVVLDELGLEKKDYLLEVGCGGGAFLKEALQSGCRAAAVDHSPDMVQAVHELNRDKILEGRLVVLEANASSLPFINDTFTCAAMTGVLGLLSDPVKALAEIRRVLMPGGRLVVSGSDPELKGTPAAPEPIASRMNFFDEEELEELARKAGFEDVKVVRRNLEPLAREAGIPEEHIPLFSQPKGGARFLVVRKS